MNENRAQLRSKKLKKKLNKTEIIVYFTPRGVNLTDDWSAHKNGG